MAHNVIDTAGGTEEVKDPFEDRKLQNFINEFKLYPIADALHREGITTEFLLSQSRQQIDEIANELTKSVIQRNKFKYAVQQITQRSKNEDAKQDDAQKEDERTAIDFTGTWVLTSRSKSIDEYYQSEGWDYVKRKMMPFVPIKQIIAQKRNELTVTIIVGPGGKFANETTVHYIDSGKQTLTKDNRNGPMQNVTKWNADKTQLLTNIYRTNNPQHTYTQVRALSVLSDDILIETITNCHGKQLVRNYQRLVQ
eukprot:796553_1